MPILNINTNVVGQVGVVPRIIEINTTDNLATITAAGYLNNAVKSGLAVSNYDMALVYGSDLVNLGHGSQLFQVNIIGSNTSLVSAVSSGTIVLPTIANHIATYVDANGKLSEDASTAINGGNIQAGLSGTAGSLISYPATAAKGNLKLTAVANSGDYSVVLSNTAASQNSVVSIPDPGNSSANFILSATANSTQVLFTNLTLSGAHNLFVPGGSVVAGASGGQGTLQCYSSTPSSGSLVIQGVANSGNFLVIFSNASFGQNTTVSFADPASATGKIPVIPGSSTLISGNFIRASGTAGVMIDSGISVANIATCAISNPDPASDMFWMDVTCSAAALTGAGQVTVLSPSAFKQYIIRNIVFNYGASGLVGIPADRLLALTDGITVFNGTGITSALLKTPVNTPWGGTGNPVPSVPLNTRTATNRALYFQYTGGTIDYATGSVVVSVLIQRVI